MFSVLESVLESRNQTGHTHFWPCLPKYFSVNFYFFVNLYQHAKDQAISSICYGHSVDLKILELDWLRAFLPISLKRDFSQIWNLCRNVANNINFHYRKNSAVLHLWKLWSDALNQLKCWIVGVNKSVYMAWGSGICNT